MSYNIYKSDGTTVSVPDGIVDQEFNDTVANGGKGIGIQLIGDNCPTYVGPIAQTFLQMTENFCSATLPNDNNALQGQLWFQKASPVDGNLYVRYSGSTFGGIANWKQIPLGTTSVVPGTYNYANFKVDSFGRITEASSNSLGTGSVTSISVTGANGIISTGSPITTTGVIELTLGNITPTSVSIVNNLTFSGVGSNQRILADFSSPVSSSGAMRRTSFQTTSTNSNTILSVLPSGNASVTSLELENLSTSFSNSAYLRMFNDGQTDYYGIEGNIRGSGNYQTFVINNGGNTAISITENAKVNIPTSLDVVGAIAASNISGTNTGDQTITLTGDISGSGTGLIITTLSDTTVVPGSYTNANITVDSNGRITSSTNGTTTLTGDVAGSGDSDGFGTTVIGINGIRLSDLATGILSNTNGTGQPTIATPGDFPILNQDTTGSAGSISGVVQIENGGTGQITLTGAINALLPPQLGNIGKYLITDGVDIGWQAPLPDQTGNAGKYLITDGINTNWQTPFPDQTGNSGLFLYTDGTTISWMMPLPDQSGNIGNYLTTDGINAIWAPVLQLNGVNVFTRNQSVQTVSVTDAATVIIDTSLSNTFQLQADALVGATREIANPINATSGMEINLWVYQSSTGGENITWGSAFKFPGGIPFTSTLTPDAIDFYKMNYSLTKNIWLVTQQANIS